jgi:hypothetical protein
VPDLPEDRYDLSYYDQDVINKDVTDSIVPESKLDIVKQNEDDFKDFNFA